MKYLNLQTLASVLLLILAAVLVFFLFSQFGANFSLPALQSLVEQNFYAALVLFVVLFIVVATFNMPGMGALTISGGVLFGLNIGTLVVSFAASIGALCSMLLARFLLQAWVEKRFHRFMKNMDERIEKDGAYYLFTLRLIPLVPFFVINPVFGLSRMPAWQFYVVSQIGMLPVIAVYVNLGATVGSIKEASLASVFTPSLIFAFAALLVLPLLLKKLLELFRSRVSAP
ncbi:TVP38/TMEM64 family protein [Agaribacterium sp. ZY112]|uniref:TVP38/TMEM64 family protein n=1 Tax=Agaribacterium sp. ZY112 TaxID=3233574 RepID=UPI0035265B33